MDWILDWRLENVPPELVDPRLKRAGLKLEGTELTLRNGPGCEGPAPPEPE
jgi:hypothetical protein